MGGFVSFTCLNCGYEEEKIAFGNGKKPEPRLGLYRCDNCHTLGSTWAKAGEASRCAGCYDTEISHINPDQLTVNCPKCKITALLRVLDETWQ